MMTLVVLKLLCFFMLDVLAVTSQSGTLASNIRLANGYFPWEGRVEVLHDGEWGTVCDDNWDEQNSAVVCRNLGYYQQQSAEFDYYYFGAGSGEIFLDEVDCIGNESSLADCSHEGWGYNDCSHPEDVGVVCSSALLNPEGPDFPDGSVRLVDGNFPSEGRVEVYLHNRWGVVCDDEWDLMDATVVCRQLGYSSVVSEDTRFGAGSLEFTLDDVGCNGTESVLADCHHAGWWQSNCYHKEAVGVICFDGDATDSMGKIYPDDFSLRLVGGNTTSEGRVELLYNGEWGTICGDGWDPRESTVVCRYIGYQGAQSTHAQFGPGSGSIYLDDVECTGSESNLAECPHSGLKVNDCNHEEDVGVICSTALRNQEEDTLYPAYGSLRLVDGFSPMEGRVEIYLLYEWGTICDDHWDVRDATVVCRQLGYTSVASEHTKFGLGAGSTPIWMDEVRCNGSEVRLANCPRGGTFGFHDCSHNEDVGVVCSNHSVIPGRNESITEDHYITYRLSGGSSPSEGVLQYRSSANETWNTACTPWPITDYMTARAFCNKVGFPFICGQDTLGNVRDSSSMAGLEDFPSKYGFYSCTENEIGGLECQLVSTEMSFEPCTVHMITWFVCGSGFEYSLGYGSDDNEGLLLARCSNTQQWHSFCGNDWLGSAHAHTVASRHFGLGETSHGYVLPTRILHAPLDIIGELKCNGEEDDLSQCTITPSVFCFGYAALKRDSSSSIELRLVDSKYEASGFVQGRQGPDGEWGAFCGTFWDSRDTQVVCRHLGFLTSLFVNRWDITGHDDLVTDSAFVSAVGCAGNETTLPQCELVFEDHIFCDGKYAYVECMAETERFGIPAYLCGEIHYCGYDCSQGPHDTLRPIKGVHYCKCDDFCSYFNDCCYDYHSSCKPAHDAQEMAINGVGIRYYDCVWTPGKGAQSAYNYFGFALVSLCPDSWTNSLVAQTCRNKADDNDVIGSLPVYDANGAVYKNVFCAICHGVQPENLKKWSAKLEYEFTGNVTYDPRFNLTVMGTPTGRYVFEPSNETVGGARTCPVKTVDSCLEEYLGTSLERACKDYFAPLYLNETNYRNPHCAMCNGFNDISPTATCGIICTPHCDPRHNWDGCSAVCSPTQNPFNIETLFDFGWGGDEGSTCHLGEIYDPFLERCRAVFCSTGLTDEQGDCMTNQGMPTIARDPSIAEVPVGVSDNCATFLNSSLGRDVVVWQFDPRNETDVRSTPFGEFTLSIITDLIGNADGAFSRSIYSLCNVSTVVVYISFGARLLLEIDTCKNATLLAGNAFDSTALDTSDMFKSSIWARENSSFTKNLLVPQECLEILKFSCLEFTIINPEEFVSKNQTSTLEVLATGQVHRQENFVLLKDGTAAVCGSIISPRDLNAFVMNIISQVCNCLSIVALIATFSVYCLFPSLRNLAGLYTMNLVVALLMANVLLFVAANTAIFGHNCVVTASLLHFSWLSVFFWMTALAYNASKTFSGKHIRVQGGSQCRNYRRLAIAMTGVWGTSLLVVGTCLTLTLCKCTSLPAIYKTSPPCWIEGFITLMGVFGVPVASSLLLSTVFFVSVFVAVRKTKMESKMVQNKGKMNDILDEVKIYVKLVLLFGITWIFAFASEVVNHVVFSYINVIINTLQGVFIFLAFCLNQRVRALFVKRLRLPAANTKSTMSGRTSVASASMSSACARRSTRNNEDNTSGVKHVNPNLNSETNSGTNQKDTRI